MKNITVIKVVALFSILILVPTTYADNINSFHQKTSIETSVSSDFFDYWDDFKEWAEDFGEVLKKGGKFAWEEFKRLTSEGLSKLGKAIKRKTRELREMANNT
jgi:hypothetical protein